MPTTRRWVLKAGGLAALLGAGIDLRTSDAKPLTAPVALSKQQLTLLGALADTFLPRTSTPGATDVGVDEFIELVFQRGLPPASQLAFTQGLRELTLDVQRTMPAGFEHATPERRLMYVQALDSELFSGTAPVERKSLLDFFAAVKRLTVIGYFTSERGAQSLLEVALFPGHFAGSQPVTSQTRNFYEDSFGVPTERPVGYLRQP